MRDPLYEAADNDLTIYQSFYKNGGANGDQTGGILYYRTSPTGGSPTAWTSFALALHADVGGSQYWKATLPSAAMAATDVIEYYVEVTFDGVSGTNPETSYIHGGDLQNNFSTTTV